MKTRVLCCILKDVILLINNFSHIRILRANLLLLPTICVERLKSKL